MLRKSWEWRVNKILFGCTRDDVEKSEAEKEDQHG